MLIGLEFSIGFIVIGVLDGDFVIFVGVKFGDCFVLIKFIGFGVIFVVEMC